MDGKFIEFKASCANGMQYFYFNLISSEKEYSIIIKVDEEGNIINSSCSCIFGSYYKFSKKNIANKYECRHVNSAIEVLKVMNYVKTEINNKHESTVAKVKQQDGITQ
jgi:hypothetical protein